MSRLSFGSQILLLCGLIFANVTIYRTISAPQVTTVSVFEIGKPTEKNKATLVRTHSGKIILVDTGSDAGILRALGETLPEWKRNIDTVVLTSGEGGSAGGLPDIMSRYRVTNVIRFGAPSSKSLESALSAAESADLHQTTAPYGTTLHLDTDTLVIITSPGIFKISYGPTSFSISSTTLPGTYVLK